MKRTDELFEIVSDAPADPKKDALQLVGDPTPPSAAPTNAPPVRPASPPLGRIVLPQGAHVVTASSLRPPAKASEPELDYTRSPLIYRVTVFPWPQRYNFYQRFCYDAERFFAVRGVPTDPVPYFSYMPQYAQLDHAQLSFYFWFREQARGGVYPDDVDFPYILLYIYEIINLPGKLAPEEGARQLAGVWLAYRARYRELDKYLTEWMCDYCLVHALPLPETLLPLVGTALRLASFKEFYIASIPTDGDASPLPPSALIAAASDYSYRASRYYAGNEGLFDELVPAALAAALGSIGVDPARDLMRQAKTERDAYCGSLCAQTVKRRIVLEYYSFARSYALRSDVTAAVKLAENGVRRMLRVKSRLTVPGGSDAVRAAVAAFFAGRTGAVKAARAADAEPEYERFYDAPEETLDVSRSHGIEAASWANTELLAPEAADEETAPAADAPVTGALAAPLAETLRRLFRGERGAVSDTDAAAINEYAADVLGDVVLEHDGEAWTLIEDYREDVASWITEPQN